jgi:hypothetical protein
LDALLLLIIFVDATKFPAAYDKWLHRAERPEREFERQGTIAERIYLDPTKFAGWCIARGLKIDAAAGMNFAAEAVDRKTAWLYVRQA